VQAEARVQWLGARGDKTVLILDASPFYPEGGGQIGDTGWIRTQSGLFVVEDTKSDPAGRIVHIGRLSEGSLEPGQLAKAEVDRDKRERSQRHHTATHLLHRALKDVLGEATSQQGSYVGPDQLRFDFNHPRPVTREQLDDVWKIINERGMEDLPVDWQIMPIDQARQMGAVMMFGEKYGEQVRVVSIGDYSRELCGGTHTHHSGELGSVVIAGESGIGSGKRRIVAYAGQPALELLTHRLRTLEQIGQRVGAPTLDDTPARIDALLAELEATRREVHRLQQQQAHAAGAQLAARARVVHGVKVVAEAISNTDPAMLEQLADAVRDELRSGVVVLGTAQNGKVQFVATVTRDLTERIHAGALIGEVASQASGRGGSKFPNFAKGSGTEPAKLGAALQHTFNVVERTLASTS
jgi:alanyl-tRNA synthetase